MKYILIIAFMFFAVTALTPALADAGCTDPDYKHDESYNEGGANRCANDCDCDGARTCNKGWCTGDANPGPHCLKTTYRHTEKTNPKGPSQCANNCDCDGARTCSKAKWCQGKAR